MSSKINPPSVLISNIILLSFFATEAFMKISQRSDESIYVSIVIKSVVVLGLVFTLLKLKKTGFFYTIGTLSLIYIIGQCSLSSDKTTDLFVVFIRYLTPLILFSAYSLVPARDKGHMFSIFKWIIVFNSALIILGLVFHIDIFRTYSGARFGYNGLFYASATGSYTYILYLTYLTNKLRKNKPVSPWNLIVVIACLLIGTKTLYLVMFFAILYLLIIKLKKHRLIIVTGAATLMMIGLLSAVLSSAYLLEFINNNNALTVILSQRDLLFLNNTLPYIKSEWSVTNYLFGGLNALHLRSQMAFVDLVLIFGFLGSFVYLWLYKKLYFNFKLSCFEFAGYALLALIVLFAGNFFMYTFTQLAFLIYKDITIRISE